MSDLSINRKSIGKDITAGLTAAIAGIPDGMAAATLAGVNPVFGLYNLMVGTPIAALFTSYVYCMRGTVDYILRKLVNRSRNSLKDPVPLS